MAGPGLELKQPSSNAWALHSEPDTGVSCSCLCCSSGSRCQIERGLVPQDLPSLYTWAQDECKGYQAQVSLLRQLWGRRSVGHRRLASNRHQDTDWLLWAIHMTPVSMWELIHTLLGSILSSLNNYCSWPSNVFGSESDHLEGGRGPKRACT